MTALLLDGKSAAARAKEQLRSRVAALPQAPNLVVVQVAGDPAADRYVKAIGRCCGEVGVGYSLSVLPVDVRTARVEEITSSEFLLQLGKRNVGHERPVHSPYQRDFPRKVSSN